MSVRGSNIYKRKDGRWEGRFKRPDTGKYCSVYGKSYSETREKLIERQKQTAVTVKKCHLTVKELFELWLCGIKHKIKDSSYANYIMKLETYIYPALGMLNFEFLSSNHINEFIHNLLINGRKGSGVLSEKYVSDITALLKSLGKFAQREFNFRNPTLYINSPKVKQKELTILSRSEQVILSK